MLAGVERLVDLVGPHASAMSQMTLQQLAVAAKADDIDTMRGSDGHFAVTQRDGQTIRMARTIGLPLRYFVAKMFHGPFLIVSDRIDKLFEWCKKENIGWQFDPIYTRMIPAHYLVELDQIGCPDPAPRYRRFFDPPVGNGPADVEQAGAQYVTAALAATTRWLSQIPDGEPVAVAFSGGVDSTSVMLLARHALKSMGRNPDLVRGFTLDLGNGQDAVQAEAVASQLGFSDQVEVVKVSAGEVSFERAISVIEDYHPLDVECAAVSLCLLRSIRQRYPQIKYLLDGDGGDENLKDYPLEDSDLTLSSVLRNPLLYQEGWGLDTIKHSLTYSGGLSRSYVRTYAPARRYGFEAFSPYTDRAAIAAAVAMPFEQLLADDPERLYTLKGDVVRAGVEYATGVHQMPVPPKRRFQDGAGGNSYRSWKLSKAWCRQVFLRQWEDRLKEAWDPQATRASGNDLSRPLPSTVSQR